jgi:isopentenyl phosphate kinase
VLVLFEWFIPSFNEIMMLTFLKLGGSLITNKSIPETPRLDALQNIAQEIKHALNAQPELRLVIGHGSGSYGHVAATQYQTHRGVETPDQWRGFAKVAIAAARLNNLVVEALDHAGVPVFRVQPSASAIAEAGDLVSMATEPIEAALAAGLVPLVFGDVAFDRNQGGAIISTEGIFSYLARRFHPQRMLLAGDYEGVRDADGSVVREITRDNVGMLENALGGSAHADVTGGMASKVESMLTLCEQIPALTVRIFSGDEVEAFSRILLDANYQPGTLVRA